MSDPEIVHLCDQCNRVVAKRTQDGTIIIIAHHDKEFHRTVIEIVRKENDLKGLTKSNIGCTT